MSRSSLPSCCLSAFSERACCAALVAPCASSGAGSPSPNHKKTPNPKKSKCSKCTSRGAVTQITIACNTKTPKYREGARDSEAAKRGKQQEHKNTGALALSCSSSSCPLPRLSRRHRCVACSSCIAAIACHRVHPRCCCCVRCMRDTVRLISGTIPHCRRRCDAVSCCCCCASLL